LTEESAITAAIFKDLYQDRSRHPMKPMFEGA
jgi:hypothetical protein